MEALRREQRQLNEMLSGLENGRKAFFLPLTAWNKIIMSSWARPLHVLGHDNGPVA